MKIRAEANGDIEVLHISGRLDLVSSSALKDQVRQRLQDHRVQIVLDCERLDFINSSGLGALVSALKDVRLSGGRLTLCRLAPYVDEIFEITGLKRVFDVYGSVADAVGSYAAQLRETAKPV